MEAKCAWDRTRVRVKCLLYHYDCLQDVLFVVVCASLQAKKHSLAFTV
jgi:hypothetical protein